jgi:hypothetical protein
MKVEIYKEMKTIIADEGKSFMRGENVIGKVISMNINADESVFNEVNDEDLPKEVEPIEEVKDEKDLELAQGEQ